MSKFCLLACICLSVMAPAMNAYAQTAKNTGAPAAQRVGTSLLENRINAATAAFKSQRFEEAARLFQEVVTQDPGHALAWHFLGQSLDRSGKKQEARSAYEKSLELQPTGSVAERNRTMLTQLRTRPEPQLPPGLTPETRNLILKSPLFTSSPATVATTCAEVGSTQHKAQSEILNDHYTRNTIYSARSDGLVEVTEDSSRNYSNATYAIKSHSKAIQALGGLQSISYVSYFGDTANSSNHTYEILSASGSLFPLKIGNRFQTRYVSKINGDTSKSSAHDLTCEVMDIVNAAVATRILGTEDALRLRCESKLEMIFLAGRDDAIRRDTHFLLCSNTLGICPVAWPMEAGIEIPDFVGGYTYTRKDIKFSIRKTCSPAK